MYQAITEEPKITDKILSVFPRFSLFKWYDTTLHFLLSLTYFTLTAFLIWRKGNRVPRIWYKFAENWKLEIRKPKANTTETMGNRVVDIR